MKDKWIISSVLILCLFIHLWGGDFALKLAKARAQAAAQQKAHKELMQNMEDFATEMDYNRHLLIMRTRPATTFEYRDWLKGYLENGGEITHVYDYNLTAGFRIVISDTLLLPRLLGAKALNFICPADKIIIIDSSGIGHNQVYYMEGFAPSDSGWVPLFKDIN